MPVWIQSVLRPLGLETEDYPIIGERANGMSEKEMDKELSYRKVYF